MTRTVALTTPENVTIEFELAGLGSRGGAAAIDMIAQGLVYTLVLLVRVGVESAGLQMASSWAGAVLGIIAFLIFWGYFVFFETVWNGQTPGKRIMRLRTIREPGLPVDLTSAAIRNLIRIVDFLPAFYVVGAVSMFATSSSKRLGDLAAGTLVVKERAEWMPGAPRAEPRPAAATPEAALVRNIELVSPEEFEALKRFALRRSELAPAVREQVAAKIARPIMQRLGIQVAPNMVYSNLLSEIHARCVEDRGMR